MRSHLFRIAKRATKRAKTAIAWGLAVFIWARMESMPEIEIIVDAPYFQVYREYRKTFLHLSTFYWSLHR